MFTVQHAGREYAINHIKSASTEFKVSDVPELDLTVVNRENNPGYEFLNEEAIVIVDEYIYRIKAESERTHYKSLKALHILIDLDEMPFNQVLNGTYSARALLTTIFSGTIYSLTLDDTGLEDVTLEEFGRCTKWEAFKKALELLGAEYTVGKGVIVNVKKEISRDRGEQFRYGHNVRSLVKKTDSSDIVTHVIVYYGEEYEHEALFVSPTASNYGRAYYGEIIKDARITNIETARKRAEKMFKDIDLSYEIDCIATNKVYELGEIVHTIYEPLNDLNVTTRVMSHKYEWNGEEFILEAVTVGNYTFKSADDLIQELIKKAEKDAEDNLDEAKKVIQIKFEDTEEKIADQYTTITTEYTSAITLSAQELRTDMTAHVQTINTAIGAQYSQITAEYTSSISQTAQQLRTDFGASITSINGSLTTIENNVSSVTQTANSLQSSVSSLSTTVSGYGTRISSAESSITQHANQISQKVSTTDYNGNTIATMINQTSTTIKLQASKIDLEGAVSIVDNNLYLKGTTAERGIYFDRYGTSGKITSTNYEMTVRSNYLLLQGAGSVTISAGYIYGFAGSATDNLYFAHSASANRLYVRVGGSSSAYNVGYIELQN